MFLEEFILLGRATTNNPLFPQLSPTEVYFFPMKQFNQGVKQAFHVVIQGPRILPSCGSLTSQGLQSSAKSAIGKREHMRIM